MDTDHHDEEAVDDDNEMATMMAAAATVAPFVSLCGAAAAGAQFAWTWDLINHYGADDDEQGKRTRTVCPRPLYHESGWARELRDSRLENPSSRQARRFRRRFRVSYQFFQNLVGTVRAEGWLPEREVDIAGRRCIPLELKVHYSTVLRTQNRFREAQHRRAAHLSEVIESAKTFHSSCRPSLMRLNNSPSLHEAQLVHSAVMVSLDAIYRASDRTFENVGLHPGVIARSFISIVILPSTLPSRTGQ